MEWVIGILTGLVAAAWWWRAEGRYRKERAEAARQFAMDVAEADRQYKHGLAQVLADRATNPIRCDVCSDAAGRDVSFEDLSWYHCPRCGEHGWMSMMGSGCTKCVNEDRFGYRVPPGSAAR